ncbi:MAG: sulfatase [Gemmatimonadota bacterium]
MRMTRNNTAELNMFQLAVWAGIIGGLAEGALSFSLSLIPGMLTWRNANSAPILFVAPVFYAPLFLLATIPINMAARRWPRVNWERGWFSVLAGVMGFCLAILHGMVFSYSTSFILGTAAAVVSYRYLGRNQSRFHQVVRKTFPSVVGLVLAIGFGMLGGIYVDEKLTLDRLPAVKANQPNVVLLVMDTERADHLSAYGYPRLTTPHIDSLAQHAVLFEQAFSAAPWTLPSHASIMTGRKSNEHGAGTRTLWNLDDRFPTLAESLSKVGYATGGFVSNLFWTGRSTGLNRGFLHYEDYFRNPADAVNRTVLGRLLLFPAIEWLSSNNDIPGRRRAADINAEMLRWIDGTRGHPFFAFANYNDVHQPYRPAKGYEGRFGSVRSVGNVRGLQIGAWDQDQAVPPAPVVANLIARYDESLLAMDHAIGALLDSLRSRKLLDHTLFIIVADHGEHFGEHGIMAHGQSLYGQEIHVPLIIRDIGVDQPGVRVAQPVSSVDIAATIAERVGLPPGAFPGSSLLSSLPGRPGPVFSEVKTRARPKGFRTVKTGQAESLIQGEWHFISHTGGVSELYNRATDPDELTNLSDSAQYRNILSNFQGELQTFQKALSTVALRPVSDSAGLKKTPQ